ncbi:unnamed protein product [Urochloa decumbens]|uniref:F-box domain-containing protein n=1 Tax=Urochloa decumbens TaxID=240449 RepID=A0ABC9B5V7_9POAL
MGVGEDRISALPDELLHDILVCLRSTRAAVRTSVLSRRWRHVWAHLPEVILSGRDAPPPPRVSSLPDSVDAALAAFSATAVLLKRLHINIMSSDDGASQGIHDGRVEASELTDLVSKHGPVLKNLSIFVDLVVVSDVSLLSDSLQSLRLFIQNMRQLEVVAPRLEKLLVWRHVMGARISCPKLAELVWNGGHYDPSHHKFEDVRRHLRLLEIESYGAASLMRQFVEVDNLKLQISIPWGTPGYERLLNETNQLPKCRTLHISLLWDDHGISPAMLHLLRSCNSARKVSINLIDCRDPLWVMS